MKTKELYQVNRHESVDGKVSYSVTKYSEDGYHGRTIDTEYSDGVDATDWCITTGNRVECTKYAHKMEFEAKIINWLREIPFYAKDEFTIYSTNGTLKGVHVVFATKRHPNCRSGRTIPYADLV